MGPVQPRLAEAGGAGHRRLGRAGGDADVVLYGSGFFPFGRSWGGVFAPSELCPIPEPEPPVLCGVLFLPPCPSDQPPKPPGQWQDPQTLTQGAPAGPATGG